MTEQQSLKGILSATFKRKGGDGHYTRLFDNLDPFQKEILLRQANLSDTELPIIGSAEAEDKWLLLTTDRLMWRSGDEFTALDVADIDDAVADFQKLMTTGSHKEQMRELQILTMNGEQRIIEVEEGAPLIGVWHVLKNLGVRNRGSGHE
jgi:hypothetical protein